MSKKRGDSMDDVVEYKYTSWCWSCKNYVTIWNQKRITTIHDCVFNHGIRYGKCEIVLGHNRPSMYESR